MLLNPSMKAKGSSKRQESKLIWKECVCKLLVHEKDEKLHQRSCIGSFSLENSLALPHGYIYKDTFYAKREKKLKSKGNLLLPSKLPSSVVLMHPSAINFLNLHPGEYVLLETYDQQVVLNCWPSENSPPSSCLLHTNDAFHLDCQKLVKIYSYSKCFKSADLAIELHLTTRKYKEFLNSSSFKLFILQKYGESLIKTGLVLKPNFLGHQCELEVAEIVAARSHFESAGLESVVAPTSYSGKISDEMTEKLHELSLQEVVSTHEESTFRCVDSCRDFSIESGSKDGQSSIFTCSTPISQRDNIKKQPVIDIIDVSLNNSQCGNQVLEGGSNQQYFKMGPQTVIKIKTSGRIPDPCSSVEVTLESIGGLHKQIMTLKNILGPFLITQNGSLNGQFLPKGVLIHGLPGTGKSLVVKAVCNESRVAVIVLKADEVFNKSPGGSPVENLRRVFQEATEKAPCILVIEDIDKLCSKDNGYGSSSERKSVADQLPTLIDELPEDEGKSVVLIATTNNIDCVDIRLRRQDRLDKEIKFDVPTSEERKEILEKLLEFRNHTLTSEHISKISCDAHGFVGRDLEQLCVKASLEEGLGSVSFGITYESVAKILRNMKPSVMQEFMVQIPNVCWSDIGGMHQVKQEIMDMVELPLKRPEAFQSSGINPSRGIILYGPPGCSKTMIAKAVATESQVNFISIKGPELFNKWVGESEKAVRELFRKARSSAPCIIFFDEIDSLAAERGSSSGGSNVGERVLTQLLVEIDGIDIMTGVSIIAATNRPDLIDPVLLRPGRFDRILYVPLPDACTRKEIFEIKLKEMPYSDDVDVRKLVEATEGYSGAEIVAVCQEAAMLVIAEDVSSTTSVATMSHFNRALNMIPPRTTKELINFYEEYSCKYKYHL